MGIIDTIRQRVEKFNNGLTSGEYIQNIILDNEAFICDMNAEEQLYEKGINRLGVSLSDYAPYSPVTIEFKREKGQPFDRVTLRDEGEFESSFFIEADREQFEIKASDWKTEELIKKYGSQILGLTDENKAEVIHEYIHPELLAIAKNIIYGND